MTKKPSVFDVASPNGDLENILSVGDVALILKQDGSVFAVNFGYDASRLQLPEDQHTDADRAMLEQGQKLFALALAAKTPRIMKLLMEMASDPDIVDIESLNTLTTKH